LRESAEKENDSFLLNHSDRSKSKKRRLIEDEDEEEEVGNIPEPAPLSNISNRVLRSQSKKLKK
jgi:hypothetical protein